MPRRTVYHVVHKDENWKIEKEGSQRASAVRETKAEAIAAARELAQNSGALSQVKIHKTDGTIQTEYTYGQDPRNIPG